MTKFIKSEFNFDGMYLTYGPDRKFVARFKHRGPFTKAKFLKELIANHTVEGYFEALKNSAPIAILRDANYEWYRNTMNKHFGKEVV
jgi:hypothetical protein